MTPAHKIAASDARNGFARLVMRRDRGFDLAHAALLVAAEEDARCDVERSLELLDALGDEARAKIEMSGDERVETLNSFMFDELGFVGNQENYYDPRNSLLNHVLERRIGIPITLSIAYMEIGRRAGLQVEGVGLPGHFIVRVLAQEGTALDVLVDPFNQKIVDEEECQQRLDALYNGQITLAPEHLRASSPRDIMIRLLRNLKNIYMQSQLHRRALAAIERILLLVPQAFDERRDRGLILAQLGRFHEAMVDIKIYLSLMPNAPDAEAVGEQLKKIEMRRAMLN